MRLSRTWWLALCAVLIGCWVSSAALAQSLKVGVLVPGSDDPARALIERTVEVFEATHPAVDVSLAEEPSEFTDAGVAAVVGHLRGSESFEAAKAMSEANVPFISVTTDQRKLAKLSDRTYTASYTKDVQGERIAAYAAAVLGARRIAVLHADSPETNAVARAVRGRAGRIGLQVATTAKWPTSGPASDFVATTFPDVRNEARDSSDNGFRRLFGPRRRSAAEERLDIDVFVVVGDGPSGADIVAQLRKANLDAPVIGTDRWDDPAFVASIGGLGHDVYVPAGNTFEIETAEAREWRLRIGEDLPITNHALYTYEALELLAAAASAGAVDPDGVAAALSGHRDPQTAVQGMTSLLYFDSDGVMQREPWFLSVHRGTLKPAFTQLRKVVDPRELWRATRAEPESPEEEVTEAAPRRRRTSRSRRRRAAAAGVSEEPEELFTLTETRTVKIGDDAYHLTSVVYAGIDFYRVNAIDVGEQTFDVEMFVWFLWQGDVDIDRIGFLNQIYTEEGVWEVLREDVEGTTKYICYKIKARFLTPFDLRDFPFDAQSLPMRLSHDTLDANNLVIVVDHDGLSQEPVRDIFPEEWTWQGRSDHSMVYEPGTTFGDPAFEGPASRSAFSVYQTEIQLKRILFPYLITLFMPLGIMVLVSLFVEVIPPHQFEARLTLVMTALLSVVVFHLSQGEGLPNVGYLMRSDQYFMISYVLLFVLIAKSVVVNMLHERISPSLLRAAELLFAAMFIPMVILAYVALTFGNPLVGSSSDDDLALSEVVEEADETEADTTDVAEGAVEGADAGEPVEAAEVAPGEHSVTCNGNSVALASVVQPILDKLEATEIPYTQSPGNELRDCSGNFLRVSSWIASQCPEAVPYLPASAGVTDFKPGGNNVFKGTIQEWQGPKTNHSARTSRGSARWYHKNGLYTPVFADSNSQGVTEVSADLKKVRNMIAPGAVLWFGKPGARITKSEGVERMFSHTSPERITHVGVVHSVERDDDGNVVGYTMYHGRRAYRSSEFEKQDNKITSHEWDTSGSSTPIPPLGNWTEPLVGIAPIVKPD